MKLKEKRVIYYEDELKDEFSEARITPRVIDKDYVYLHRNPLWNAGSFLAQNVLSMPIKLGYAKGRFRIRYVGKEKLRECRGRGFFVYGNHTQPFADTFIPSIALYPTRNYFIVNPENVSMKGLHTIVEMLGALPVPGDTGSLKHFLAAIETLIGRGRTVTIYPEAHIWPFYTGIRPFSDVSFKYPVRLKTPVYCMTNTYQSYGRRGDKVRIVTYIDGPFYPEESLAPKERQRALRDKVYEAMVARSKNSNVDCIEYHKKEK